MIDHSTRILALEARLDDVQRMQMTHDLLIRSLLARLALVEPEVFDQLESGLAALKVFREGGAGGELPREVSEEIAAVLGEIRRSVAKRR
jgi:hypothetical protein